MFGVLVALILSKFLYELGLWQWAMEHWPYEYGRAHSKNLIAPTGILAVVVAVSFWSVVKKTLFKDRVLNQIKNIFENDLGKAKAEKYQYASVFLTFFNIFAGAMFAAGIWSLFGFCVAVWVAIELWVRKAFYSSGIKQ